MKVIEPTAYKLLRKELGKPPSVVVTPIISKSTEDIKKAKMLQKLMNYMFKNNYNGVTTKYYNYMRRKQKEWLKKELYGVQVRWDKVEKSITQ